MKVIDALHYLNYAVKEGYISEDYAQDLLDLPYQEFVKEIEKMIDRGDSWAEDVIKGEI